MYLEMLILDVLLFIIYICCLTAISVTARNYTTLMSPYKLDLHSIRYMSYVSHTYLSLFFSLNIEAYHACIQYLYLRTVHIQYTHVSNYNNKNVQLFILWCVTGLTQVKKTILFLTIFKLTVAA